MNRIRFCQCVDSLGKGINHQGTHKTKKNENEGAWAHHILCITYYRVLANAHNQTVTHLIYTLYSSTFQPVLSTTTRQKTGLGHHGFHVSLVGGVIGAETNSHDLLARSSTCCCRLEDANNTGSLAKIKQHMLNILVKHIDTNSQKTAIHVFDCWFVRVFMIFIHVPFHPGTLDDISMVARYVLKLTTMQSMKQAFSNQTKL